MAPRSTRFISIQANANDRQRERERGREEGAGIAKPTKLIVFVIDTLHYGRSSYPSRERESERERGGTMFVRVP